MSRILTLQRQARELGRLRTGTFDEGAKRPSRSDTWVISSHSADYIEAAADAWGGAPEKWSPQGGGADQFRVVTHTATVDAILPPGDPLSQSYEMWSKGGCTRRCDGITEQLTDAPCACRARFGEDFHEQRAGTVCAIHTRLNVILPALPDMGYWRAETKSYWAANELAGAVDMVRGLVGPQAMIPVRLRIEQRSRVAGGKRKNFPVVVLELRGITAGQVLEGAGALPQVAAPAVAAPSPRPELTAAPPPAPAESKPIPDYLRAARAALSLADWRKVWNAASEAGHLTDELKRLLTPIGQAWAETEQATAPPEAAPPAASTVSDRDPDDVWADIVRKTPEGWSLDDLENDFAQFSKGLHPGSANATELEAYLAALKGGTRG